jgi:small-conductance mechanosensitive channel
VSENPNHSSVSKNISLPLIILKEFYRLLLLALSIFFFYYLIANSNIFDMGNTVKEITIKFIFLGVGLLIATFIIKILNVFLWESYQEKRTVVRIPNLLRQGVNLMVYTATIFIVLKLVFRVSITGLLTATGALGVVVGLALKEIISDIFAGIIINLDRTVKIGDWIKLEIRANSEKIGCIADMNWRSVHLVTPENVLLIVPNSLISNSLISNLSMPDHNKEMELTLNFDFDVPSERVIRVINAALLQTKEILQSPEPKTRISKVSSLGVEYKVKYWIKVSSIGPGKARGCVLKSVMYNLSQAGMTMSYPKSDVFTAAMPVRNLDIREDRFELLRKIDLFSLLSSDEIAKLAFGLKEIELKKDEFIIRLGEAGSSMYILVEGLLNAVIIDPKDNTETNVAQLKPGSYFGEMSLMTGEPRSASICAVCDSVLFEVSKESISELLAHNPEIAETFSQKITGMKLKNEYISTHKHDSEKEPSQQELTTNILSKIKKFFNLSNE